MGVERHVSYFRISGIFLAVLLVIGLVLPEAKAQKANSAATVQSPTLLLCLNSSGNIIAKRRCRANETRLNRSNIANTVGIQGIQGPQGPAGPAGAPGIDGNNSVIAFASIGGGTLPTVLSAGGSQASNVTVQRTGQGRHVVRVQGTFSGLTSINQITPIVTIRDTDNFHVASLSSDESSASATEIVLVVWTWSTRVSPNPLEDVDFSLAVLR